MNRLSIIVAALLTSSLASAEPIALVLSEALPPYQLAQKGIVETRRFDTATHPIEDIAKIPKTTRALVAVGAKATVDLRQLFPEHPIVFCMILNPERYQLPNGKMTGVALNIDPESQFRAVRMLLPKAKRIGVLYDPAKSGSTIKLAQQSANARGLTLSASKVTDPKDVPKLFRELLDQIDVYWLIADSTVVNEQSFEFMLLYSVEKKIPMISYSKNFVKAGALVSLSADYYAIGKQTGQLVQRILEGEAADSIPVQYPKDPRLVLNLKTATRLGLNFDAKLVSEAEEVY